MSENISGQFANPLFNKIKQEVFLKEHWQQKPYVFRDALTESVNDIVEVVDGNELAGLACEEMVESRIIFGSAETEEWRCEQGVFDEDRFASLPEKNWTLLVQGLDQWFEEVRDLFHYFDFLPQWRLEDIMASYAPKGGGVGPHFDYYDVFLIQVSGTREWKLGQQCDEQSELQNNDQVKLLQEFLTEETHHLKAGDILYVPAGKAHWGTAKSDDCITFSVGFRAPSEKELITHLLENIIEKCADNLRYQDSVEDMHTHPAKIASSAKQQVSQLLQQLSQERLQEAAQQAFGELVTESRYFLSDECMDEVLDQDFHTQVNQIVSELDSISIYSPVSTRLAFSDAGLFVNGKFYSISGRFAKSVCDGKIVVESMSDSERLVLIALLEQGDVSLSE
jgi:50S ribosomal protein L16 3-hydroxylase